MALQTTYEATVKVKLTGPHSAMWPKNSMGACAVPSWNRTPIMLRSKRSTSNPHRDDGDGERGKGVPVVETGHQTLIAETGARTGPRHSRVASGDLKRQANQRLDKGGRE